MPGLPNDDHGTALIKACLAAAAKRFNTEAAIIDVSTFNASRIAKVPGTTACKGDHTAARPHRLSNLLDVPDLRQAVALELLEGLAATAPTVAKAKPRTSARRGPSSFDLDRWIASVGIRVKNVVVGKTGGRKLLLEECPFQPADHGGNPFIEQMPGDGPLIFLCYHGDCLGKDWKALRQHMEQGREDRSGPAQVVQGPSGNWSEQLSKDQRGQPRASLANAMLAIRAAWPGVLHYDAFALRTIAVKATPWGFVGTWPEHQDAKACEWLNQQGILVWKAVAAEAVEAVAREREVHPVREYFTAIQWDGVHRISTWLNVYLGVQRTAYSDTVGRKWMIGGAARIMKPGCQMDTVLTVESPQGRGKSSAFSILGGPFYTDDVADLGSKDCALQVAGAWLIELSELEAMAKAELSKQKAFITRRTDRFRPPYGRRLVENPRQCIFCGTVNLATYLNDASGARRFWPVRAGVIDLSALARDRDLLWAEALVCFRAGETWWLDNADVQGDAEDEQADRYESDAWEDIISAWVEAPKERYDRQGHPIGGFSSDLNSIHMDDVLGHCIGKRADEWTQIDKARVGRCLRRLGFELVQKRVGDRKSGRRERFYVRS